MYPAVPGTRDSRVQQQHKNVVHIPLFTQAIVYSPLTRRHAEHVSGEIDSLLRTLLIKIFQPQETAHLIRGVRSISEETVTLAEPQTSRACPGLGGDPLSAVAP